MDSAQKAYIELLDWLNETRDEPLETMFGFFEKRIGDYEEHMSRWAGHYKWMAELIPQSADNILDIGCGTGLELDEIFKLYPNISVTGIDLCKPMLDKLQSKHAGKSLTLIEADYFRYDLPENTFDAVIAFETLHHFSKEKKAELYAKLRRCLKPGGMFLECDYISASLEIEKLVFSEYYRRRELSRIPADAFVHFDTPLTVEHELEALTDAGFAGAEVIGYLEGDPNTAMIKAYK